MKIILYLVASLFLSTKVAAQEAPLVWDESSVFDDWQRAVRDFRRDHNFGVLLGRAQTHWQGSTSDLPRVDTKTTASELTLQYSFHIPWTKGFGYSLGTSASVMLADEGSSTLENHYRASLPGLEAGLVWNATDRLRCNLGVLYGWERVDGLKIAGQPGRISLTEESLSGKVSIDYFYKLTWAVRLEVVSTEFPSNASASHDLEKSILRTRLGLIKHLL